MCPLSSLLALSPFFNHPFLISSITKGLIQNVHSEASTFAYIFSLFVYECCSETQTCICLFVSIHSSLRLNVIHLELPSHPGWCFGWCLGENSQHLMYNIQSYVTEWGHLHWGRDRCWTGISDAAWYAVKKCDTQNEILRSVSMPSCRRAMIYLFHMSFSTYLCLYICICVCFCAPSMGH